MAQEMADALTEEIVRGTRKPGDALPTEPQLSEEFQVSRSVVRDATRILAARGLVDVQHGRGAFVTESQLHAFGEALFLALRRESASVWDVEEFFRTVWPDVFAMAAQRADETELKEIRRQAERYIALFREVHEHAAEEPDPEDRIRAAYGAFLQTVMDAAHNKVFSLLVPPFRNLQSLRNWQQGPDDISELAAIEGRAVTSVVEALESRDPERSRRAVSVLFELPPEAVDAMRNTAVGETVHIPVSLAEFARRYHSAGDNTSSAGDNATDADPD
jgi:DNA-binding FadR family transcriptional regulator